MTTINNNHLIDYRSKEIYDKISSLTLRREDLVALQRAKRERAIGLDRTTLITAELKRKLKAVSDRLLEALVKYEDYIAKALTTYSQYQYHPQSIEIKFWIQGDKDHRHLSYPQWYYQLDYHPSRQQRLEIAQLEKEMASEPNWVDVNEALYSEEYRSGDEGLRKGSDISLCSNWLRLRWSPNYTLRIADIIAHRSAQMAELSRKDADGICEAFYRLKDIYCLALEDMLDITDYKVDLQAKIINY